MCFHRCAKRKFILQIPFRTSSLFGFSLFAFVFVFVCYLLLNISSSFNFGLEFRFGFNFWYFAFALQKCWHKIRECIRVSLVQSAHWTYPHPEIESERERAWQQRNAIKFKSMQMRTNRQMTEMEPERRREKIVTVFIIGGTLLSSRMNVLSLLLLLLLYMCVCH